MESCRAYRKALVPQKSREIPLTSGRRERILRMLGRDSEPPNAGGRHMTNRRLPRLGVFCSAVVIVLASILALGGPPEARAQVVCDQTTQCPNGCSGTGVTLNIFVRRADGVTNAGAGGSVSPCETIKYDASLTGGTA